MNVDFADVFQPLFDDSYRFYVSDGGRGGGRSWAFARALLLKASNKTMRILCAREYQNSIKDSVHRLLSDQVELMGLASFFTITRDAITGINGSEFIFKGLHHNVSEIKSMEGIDICWIEEAEKVSEESWSFLIPTIRKPNSQIWITFNPYQEKDPTYQRFIIQPPPKTIRMKAGYRENPWFPDILKVEMEHDKNTNMDRYLWIWEGNPLGLSDAQVFKNKYSIETFDTPADAVFYHGADWGFAQDPSCMIRSFIQGNKLYIDREAWGIGVEIDHLPAMFDPIETAKEWVSYADSARPETISYLNRNGYPSMKSATKWSGSVEDGIAYLKGFEKIIVHPSCKHTIEEFGLYQYKIDKQTGDILPVILDKNNHCIDALRYSLSKFIMSSKISMCYGSFNHETCAIDPVAIEPKDAIYIAQDFADGFFRPVAFIIRDGKALAVNEFEPPQMIEAPKMIRDVYPDNPIVWYLDISTMDVFPAYRQAIIDQRIQLQVGTIGPSPVERPVIVNKMFMSDRLKIAKNCNRAMSAISSRVIDRDGKPEKGDGAMGIQYICTSFEYCVYRISSSRPDLFGAM